jgi:hypothetical protein
MLCPKIPSEVNKLRTELRDMRYSGQWSETGLASGDPRMYLRLLHFFALDYSVDLKKWIVDRGYTLQTADDRGFVEQIFRLLQVELEYRPKLTPADFLKPKMALQKLIICREFGRIVRTRWKRTARPELPLSERNGENQYGQPEVRVIKELNTGRDDSTTENVQRQIGGRTADRERPRYY